MDVRRVPRSALDLWLRVARTPIDVATRALPNGETGPRNAVKLAVDRADAGVRDVIGKVFGDEELRHDALRRRVAADERREALRLRAEADVTQRTADAELAKRRRQADARRTKAGSDAQAREEAVDREKAEHTRQLRDTTAKQARAIDQVRANKLESAEHEARQERLEVLDEEAAVLDHEADALTAKDEAQRLRTAAARTKSARKRPSPS